MPTNCSRTYLLKVLERMAQRHASNPQDAARAVVEQIREKLVRSKNVEAVLAKLYSVQGFDALALHLMWVGQSPPQGQGDETEHVLDAHADLLGRLLRERTPSAPDQLANPPSLLCVLNEFGRRVADFARSAVAPGDEADGEDLLLQLAEETDRLKLCARRDQDMDIARFCDALKTFIRYVLNHRLVADHRCARWIESANVTLQTRAGGGMPEDSDVLENTICLLLRPEALFETPFHEGV